MPIALSPFFAGRFIRSNQSKIPPKQLENIKEYLKVSVPVMGNPRRIRMT
jgi:hypothetical protein